MKKIVFFCVILQFLITPLNVSGLSCKEYSLDNAFRDYDGVVIGVVDKVFEENAIKNHVRVKVETSYKGILENWIFVEEDVSYGEQSKEGQKNIYFLKKEGNRWINNLCSPTQSIKKADKELDFLEDKEIHTLEQIEKPDKPIVINWFIIGGISAFVGIMVLALRQFAMRI